MANCAANSKYISLLTPIDRIQLTQSNRWYQTPPPVRCCPLVGQSVYTPWWSWRFGKKIVVCPEIHQSRYCSVPNTGAEYCDGRVCLLVCLWAYLRIYLSDLQPIFCACYLCPWLGSPHLCTFDPAFSIALWYVSYGNLYGSTQGIVWGMFASLADRGLYSPCPTQSTISGLRDTWRHLQNNFVKETHWKQSADYAFSATKLQDKGISVIGLMHQSNIKHFNLWPVHVVILQFSEPLRGITQITFVVW